MRSHDVPRPRLTSVPLLSLATAALLLGAVACDRTSDKGLHPQDGTEKPDGHEDGAAAVIVAASTEAKPDTVIKDGAHAVEFPPETGDRWTLVREMDGPTELYDFERGVLAAAGGKHYTVDDGRLVEVAGAGPNMPDLPPWAEAQARPVEGSFPADAWLAQIEHYDRAGASLTIAKYVPEYGEGQNTKTKTGWVAQRLKAPKVGYFSLERGARSLEADDMFMLRKSAQAGYLIAGWDEDAIGFARVGGGRAAPRKMDLPAAFYDDAEAYPVDFHQDPTGRIHVFGHAYATDDVVMLTSRRCKRSVPKCEATMQRLPKTPHGNVAMVTTRGDRNFTAGLNDNWSEQVWASHLIHYDGHGYTTERAPGDGHVRTMVAAADGGLWAVVETKGGRKRAKRGEGEAELWHRDRDGAWTRVDLPELLRSEGAEGIDVAIDETDQLWLAVNGETRSALFTVNASGDSLV